MKDDKGNIEKEVNISYPTEMIPFIDRLIARNDLQELGITSRRRLTIVILGILRERIEILPKAVKVKVDFVLNNVSLPEQYSKYADDVSEMRIAKMLWLGYKTQILSAMLRSLMYKTDPDFARLANILDISVEDIRRYVSSQRSTTMRKESQRSKEAKQADAK